MLSASWVGKVLHRREGAFSEPLQGPGGTLLPLLGTLSSCANKNGPQGKMSLERLPPVSVKLTGLPGDKASR